MSEERIERPEREESEYEPDPGAPTPRGSDVAARWGWDSGELAAMKAQAREDGGW